MGGEMEVSSEQFEAVVMTIARASILISGPTQGASVGIDEAASMEDKADEAASALHDFLHRVQGENGDDLARLLGWPSRDALVAFLYDGPSAGGVQ